VGCLDENDAVRLLVEPHDPGAAALRAHVNDCESCRELVATVAKVVVDDASEGLDGWTAPTLRPGTRVGPLRVIETIGRGAMGTVYLAEDERLRRRVALKMLAADASDHDAMKRLRVEARAMARLRDPHVVQVLDVGLSDHGPYVAMQYVDGEDLRTWLAKGERPTPQILHHLRHAGRGLAAAHAAGLVHRDFKPANVLVGRDGLTRVADFGLAILRRDAETTTPPSPLDPRATASLRRSTTRHGTLAGTPAYMAPEQLRGRAVGPAADQFAFCVTAYEALAGHRPFREDTLAARIDATERGLVERPERPIPGRVLDVLRRGLAADPDARFPDMLALLDALDGRSRSRHDGTRVAIGVPLGLAIVLLVALGWRMRADPPAPEHDPVTADTAPTPPPQDPASVAKSSELTDAYLRAKADGDRERMQALRPQVRDAIAGAAAAGDTHTHADLLHTAGVIESDHGDFARAAASFEESYHVALGAGLEDLAFDAALDRSLVSAAFRADEEDSWRWARHARAVLAHRPHDDARAVALLVREGSLHLQKSEIDAADRALTEAAARAGDSVPAHLLISLHCDLGQLRAMQKELAGCLDGFSTALRIAETREGSESREVLRPLVGLATCKIQNGQSDDAERDLQRAIAIAERSGDRPAEAMAHGNLGLMYRNVQRPTAALRELLEADRSLREVYGGDHPEIARSASNVADAHAAVGHWEDAIASAHEAVRVAEAQAHAPGSIRYNAALTLAHAELELGAPSMVARMRALVDEAPTDNYRAEARIGLLQALLAEGRAEEALAIAEALHAGPTAEIPAMSRHRWAEGWLLHALACRQLGRAKESREALAKAGELAAELQADDPRGIVQRIADAREQ
jgi:serine/threonine protein kinase/tetratricopeptide (TPR) repeat protein